MEKLQKWYMCKRDIVVTVAVMFLAFFLGPKFNDIFPIQIIEDIHPYMGLLIGWGYITALSFVLVESFFIHLEHYWQWSVVALFSSTGARFVGQDMLSTTSSATVYVLVYDFVWNTIANGLFYIPFVIPIVALVFFIRRKIERR